MMISLFPFFFQKMFFVFFFRTLFVIDANVDVYFYNMFEVVLKLLPCAVCDNDTIKATD